MRKIFTLILLVSGILKTVSAQTPTWLWAETAAGGNNYQYGDGAAIDDSGFYYMGGRFAPTLTFGTKSLTTGALATQFFGKFDENGNCLWLAKQFYSNGYDYPRGFCIDRAKNNNVYATGLVSSGSSMYVVKFNNNGVLQWSTTLGAGSGYTTCPNAQGIAADTAGNVYVTGQTGGGSGSNWTFGDSVLNYSGTSSSQEMFLTKLDKNGNLLWAIGADGSTAANDGYDVGRSVTLDQTGQYVFVAGGYYGTPSFHSKNPSGDIVAPAQSGANSTLFIAKYDTGGNLIFVTTAPGAGIPWTGSTFISTVGASNSIATDSCDDIFITGGYSGSTTFGPFTLTAVGANDGFVACCNSKGQWQWADDIGGTGNDGGSSIALDKNNDVYVGGGLSGTANFGYGISATATASGDAFIAKYANSTGAVQWVLTPTGSGASGGGSVAVDNQKFVYFTGSFSGTMSLGTNTITYNGGFGQGIYIAKLDTVPARYIIPVVDSSYCPGSTVNLPYSIIGTFNAGNSFIAQLSDSTGSFVNAKNIGADTSTTGGTISITIPSGISGSTYLIRVISTNPATSSYVNGCGAYYQKNVYINNFYVTIGGNLGLKISNDTSICSGTSLQLNISGGSTWSWSPGKSLSDSTIANPIASPVSPQTYTVVVHSGVCVARDSITVGVNPSATITATPHDTAICNGLSVALNSTGGSSYSWSPASSLTNATISNPIATPTVTTTYTVSGSSGCTLPDTVVVNVSNTATGGIIVPLRDTLCSGTTGQLTLTAFAGSPIQWQSSATLGNFAGITSANDTTYTTLPLSQSTYYRVVVGSGNCLSMSDSLLLYVPPALSSNFGFTQSGKTVTFTDSSIGNIITYEWTFGDGSGSILENPTHTYPKNDTTYNVCLAIYDGSNCSYTFCKDVTLATGIPQISAQTNWNIYPDPFSSQLLISGKDLNAKIETIEMYDVLGRTVFNETPGNLNSSVITLNLSDLAEGMYYLKIKTATANYIQKVIKQGN